jgi:DNA-binding winged helix-turn-helix (wHTH) protein
MFFQINNTYIELLNEDILINGIKVSTQEKICIALRLFIHSQNKVISKEQLMQELWNGMVVSDDSLFKIIQELRKIFKSNGMQNNVLANVYGKGYKINPKIITIEEEKKTNLKQLQHEEKKNTLINSQKKSPLLKNILIFTPILLLSLVAIYFIVNKSKVPVFTADKYSKIIKKIEGHPVQTLFELNKKYDIEQFKNAKDKASLYYLKGFAYFNQGHYKECIENLEQAIEVSKDKPVLATADAYAVLSLIHLYKSNPDSMLSYLEKAQKIYETHNNSYGWNKVESLRPDYFILTNEYQKSIDIAEIFLEKSIHEKNKLAQIYAYTDLAYAYKELNDIDKKNKYLDKVLKLALEVGNGRYISLVYGTKTMESMYKGQFIQAMNWVNKTLKYAVVQPNTNDFQQGFSYLYNILSPLGHDKLAEKYLLKGIDVQNHFNRDGHLIVAETNLGILKVKLKKYIQAKEIFSNLLSYNLTKLEFFEVKAWQALNYHYLKDNISAYTQAKKIYIDKEASNKNRLVAGTALIFSLIDLEQINDADRVLQDLNGLANKNWLIEYEFFLTAALKLYQETNQIKRSQFVSKKKEFDEKLATIKRLTPPDTELLKELDRYLDRILNPVKIIVNR